MEWEQEFGLCRSTIGLRSGVLLFFRGFDFGGKDRCWNDTVDAVDAVVTVDTA